METGDEDAGTANLGEQPGEAFRAKRSRCGSRKLDMRLSFSVQITQEIDFYGRPRLLSNRHSISSTRALANF
jgi:hypothetical protein